jgi:5-methylcytosine-specific restriction endonuclease McrA
VDINGMHIPAWSGRRRAEALAQVKAEGRRRRSCCCICHQEIDYNLAYPDEQSCSVQHVKSRKSYPHLTWEPSNWEPAHLGCNKAAGISEELGLGATSEDW